MCCGVCVRTMWLVFCNLPAAVQPDLVTRLTYIATDVRGVQKVHAVVHPVVAALTVVYDSRTTVQFEPTTSSRQYTSGSVYQTMRENAKRTHDDTVEIVTVMLFVDGADKNGTVDSVVIGLANVDADTLLGQRGKRTIGCVFGFVRA